MSNFEESGNNKPEEGAVDSSRLPVEDVARFLGASVVIPVSNPLEALQIYHQRQAAIREQIKGEAEA